MSAHDNGKQGSLASPPNSPMVAGTETLMRNSIFLPNLVQAGDQGPPLPSGLSAAPTASTLWRAFCRVAPTALIAGILTAALAVAAVYVIAPPKYPVSVLLKVDSSKASVLGGGAQEDVEFSMLKSFQMELIKSREVITRALEMQVKDLVKAANGMPVDARYVKDLPLVRSQADPIDWLQGIKAEPHLKSQEIIVVSAASRDRPEDLAIVMNALAKALEEENQSREDQKFHGQVEQAKAKQLEGQQRLEQKRKLLIVKSQRGKDSDAQTKSYIAGLDLDVREDKKTLKNIDRDIDDFAGQIKNLQTNVVTKVPVEMVNEIVKNDPAAAPILAEQVKAEKDLIEARKVTSDRQSLFRYEEKKRDAERDVEDFKQQNYPTILKRYVEKLQIENASEIRKLEGKLVGLREQRTKLTDSVAKGEAELARHKGSSVLAPDIVALMTEIEALDAAQKALAMKIEDYQANTPKARVAVHQYAIVPGGLDYSRFSKLAGAGGIGGFLLAILAVSFREFRWRKICTGDEVSRGLGLPLLGTVPSLPEATRSSLVSHGKVDPLWQNQLIEAVDTIRTLLLHNARANNTRVIMISSAVGGEGKTTLASQLAASLARAWKKTLLIDGDLRSPSAHKLFEVAQEPGLSEVLRGEINSAEAIRSTPLSRLWIMPAGHWDSHAVQALAQDSVRTLLEELKQQYDFIILDSSPILPVADALLLGQNVDGVLLTVMRDLSRAPALYAAHQRLEGLGIKTLGAVMMGASSELGPLGYKYAAQARR
jgi:polysaccharide biosynthesis transport protein